MPTYELVPASACDPEDVLDVIGQAFGRARTMDWFCWKHRDGPWGPSTGVAAVDGRGIIGVRLLLPWGMRYGATTTRMLRAVEAATTPRAQGRGVFSRLNRALMAQASDSGEISTLFSTPNHKSRGGYAKLGWTSLPPIAHVYRLVRPVLGTGRGTAVLADDSLDGFNRSWLGPGEDAIHTDWTEASLRWRTDPRSGHRYSAARLRSADDANGAVYRVLVRRGLRLLLVLAVRGTASERRALVHGIARWERASVALETSGRGSAAFLTGPSVRRGGSLLMVWGNGQEVNGQRLPVEDIGRWRLGAGLPAVSRDRSSPSVAGRASPGGALRPTSTGPRS